MELLEIRGIGPIYRKRLKEAGVHDAADLAWVGDLAALSGKTDIPMARLASLQAEAVRVVAARHRPPHLAIRGMSSAVSRLAMRVRRSALGSAKVARSWVSVTLPRLLPRLSVRVP